MVRPPCPVGAIHASRRATDFPGVLTAPAFSDVLDEKLGASGVRGQGTVGPSRVLRDAAWGFASTAPFPSAAAPRVFAAYRATGPARAGEPAGACLSEAQPSARRAPDAPVRLTTAQEREALARLRRLGADDLGPTLATTDLKRAFRELARRYHPDSHPDLNGEASARFAAMFAEAADAYRTLVRACATGPR